MMLEGYLSSFVNLKFLRAFRKIVCIVSSLFLSIITFEWNLLNVSLSEATTLVTPFPSSIPKTKIIFYKAAEAAEKMKRYPTKKNPLFSKEKDFFCRVSLLIFGSLVVTALVGIVCKS